MIEILPSLSSNILTNVTDQFADVGTLAIVALAGGIPLAFYSIKFLVSLFQERKTERLFESLTPEEKEEVNRRYQEYLGREESEDLDIEYGENPYTHEESMRLAIEDIRQKTQQELYEESLE